MDIGFEFPLSQWPYWLALGALLTGWLALVLRNLELLRSRRMHAFVEAALAPRLLVGYNERLRRPLFWLCVLGFAFLLMALAQPRWGSDWVEVQRTSRDILVLLDTSLSMSAENPPPSRMHRARQKIASLVERCPGDRFGLVAFAGRAAMQCPLTVDHAYFRTILGVTDEHTISELGTDIESALEEARAVFAEEADRAGGRDQHTRVVLLISDGEAIAGDAVRAAQRLSEDAVIYAMGIGDPEGVEISLPRELQPFLRGRDAPRTHVTRLDEDTLREIAAAGGGAYVRATPHNADVDFLHGEWEGLAAEAMEGELRYSLINRYRWFLSIATLCFAAEGVWLAMLPWLRRWRMRRDAAQRGEEPHYA